METAIQNEKEKLQLEEKEKSRLKLRISPSEKEFKELVGIEEFNKIRDKTLKRDKITCKGCGYHPLDESNALKSLSLHVESITLENPSESPCSILCLACHSTQHIDVAIEKGWVQLVNSSFSQKRLIETCRINAHSSLNNDNTRFLKTTPTEYLEKLKNDTLSTNSRVKVLFTTKFEWGDL